MKLALVFAPFDHKKFEEDTNVVSNNFIQAPPLGLLYVASILQQHKHEVLLIDAECSPRLSKEEVLAKIKEFNPSFVCFMLTIYMFQQTLGWIKYIKSNFSTNILVGNIGMELYPREILSHQEIDFGIIGSAQKSLPEFLEKYAANESYENIEGLAFKKNAELRINYPSTLEENFDTLPLPARQLLDNSKYYSMFSKLRNFTIMITTKGCPYKCKFCHIGNIPYQEHSVERVIKELEDCYNNYNIRDFEIFDPDFTANKKRTAAICEEIIRRGLKISWACRTRVDQVDDELLKLMKRAGCHRIYYGIESGNEKILQEMNKNISKAKVIASIKATRKAKIKALGFFLIGAKGDTEETVRETINFAKKLQLNYAQFHKVVAKPTTTYAKELENFLGYDYWREYILGKVEEKMLPMPWTSLSLEKIEELTKKAYISFYFRPSIILNYLLDLRSWSELKRYFWSAIGLFFVKKDSALAK